jgi:hypothetical protein
MLKFNLMLASKSNLNKKTFRNIQIELCKIMTLSVVVYGNEACIKKKSVKNG